MKNSELLSKTIFVSIYDSCSETISKPICFEKAISRLKDNTNKKLILKIRATTDKNLRNSLKKKLKAITWCGVFTVRNKFSCTDPSGLACLDFDNLNDPYSAKEKLKSNEYVLACWLSPSGTGLKVLIRIPLVTSDAIYKKYYRALITQFKNYNPDTGTKDISRLCFESFDPDLYLNTKAVVFTKKKELQNKSSYVQNNTHEISVSEGVIIKRLYTWWKKKYDFSLGNRHNNLLILCRSLCEFGVSKNTSIALASQFECTDFRKSEIENLVQWAYQNTSFNTKSFKK